MRVLIIKISSLGDIIHTLPALTEAKRHCPNILFDWLVDESFEEIPRWHPAIDQVITIPLRRWRKHWKKAWQQGEIKSALQKIRANTYDLIIDAQGLFKSALLTWLCKGKSVGLSFSSAREPLASLFYQQKIEVPNYKKAHAVQRARILFAKSLGYPVSILSTDAFTNVSYGLENIHFLSHISKSQKPYCVFLHGTTWTSKLWPEAYWLQLSLLLNAEGFDIKLPWGNAIEYAVAKRIKAHASHVEILAKSSLSELAAILDGATAVISMDTGLGHLTAALGIPTVALFGSTDPVLTRPMGQFQETLGSTFSCAPCLSRVCTYKGEKAMDPPCYTELSPERVIQSIKKLLSHKDSQKKSYIE
jgi:heptosyltransferase-1